MIMSWLACVVKWGVQW